MVRVGYHQRFPRCELNAAPLAAPPPPHALRLVRPNVLPLHLGPAPRERALGRGEPALRQVLRESPQLPGPVARLLRFTATEASGRARGGKDVVEIGRVVGATFPGQERNF